MLQTLNSPNAQFDGNFGWSVAISGKIAIVGAVLETAGGFSSAGHAYVFNPSTGKLLRTLTSSNAQSNGYFGQSVGISGQLAIVGAYGETSDTGHAYVFNANTGKLLHTLNSPNKQSFGDFGWSVGVSGQLAMVGAFGETVGGFGSAGHAYIFNATSGKVIQPLNSPNAQSNGNFGRSVSISAKVTIVGADHETVGGFGSAGHAYVF
jgi:outer membrane protein assembly factor BamB